MTGRRMKIIAIPSVLEIVETLRTMPGVSDVEEPVGCIVHIGRSEYNAARYVAKNKHVTEPDVRLYVCGSVPPSYKRSSRIYYICNDVAWYVASYVSHNTATNPLYKRFHPLGMWFGMHQHPNPNRSHPTMPMTIEDLEF